MVKTRVIILWEVEGRDAHEQIVFGAFHSVLVEVQTNAGNMQRMRNNNLEIRIAGSSCHPQTYGENVWNTLGYLSA